MQTWLRRKDINRITVHEEGRRLVPTLSWPHLVALAWQALWIVIIIRVSARLFRHKGFDGTTIRDIAKAAGMHTDWSRRLRGRYQFPTHLHLLDLQHLRRGDIIG